MADRAQLQRTGSPALAFLGDAVYEVYVRRYVLEKGLLRSDRLNTAAVKYVRAEAQAEAYDRLQPLLTEEEASVARRGKNHKVTSMPKHVDPLLYRKATGFEALIGYLDLAGETGRLEELIRETFRIIEDADLTVKRG